MKRSRNKTSFSKKKPKLEESCRRKENAEENAYFLDDLLTDVKDVSFYFYRVTENFNPTSAFSRIDLNMAPFKSTDGAHIGIKAEELYKLNQITATGENRDAVHFICTCKDIPWPPFTQMSEHTAFIEISRQILAPISGKNEVILDRTYRNLLKDLVTDSRLTSDCIGFGSSETWHGSPDARVRGTEIIGHNFIDDDATEPFGSDNDEEISDTCSNVSTGTTTTIETKHLQQLVATCVVSSFIENNLQKKLPSMVPSILIDANGFSICFYDCVDDILLISQTIQLLSKTNRLSSNGVLLLWLTINHRKYINKLQIPDTYQSTIQSRLGSRLQYFKKLSCKNLEWSDAINTDSKRITAPSEAPFQNYRSLM